MNVEEYARLATEVRLEHNRLQRRFAETDRRLAALKGKNVSVTLKAASDGTLTLRGLATSGNPDRMGDIVEPDGGEWKLPVPLLQSHDHTQPIGRVIKATRVSAGIEIEAALHKGVSERVDESIKLIQLGYFPDLSIGFRGLESKQIATGLRFTRWEMIEVSVVAVGANSDAKIISAKGVERKCADKQVRAWV